MFLMPRWYKLSMKQCIEEAKREVREAQGLRTKCMALYNLWRARDHFSTLTNRVICWWTRTNKVIAGALFHEVYDGALQEKNIKYVEEDLGCKVLKKARAIVDRVLAVQAENRLMEKKADQERQERHKVELLEQNVRILGNAQQSCADLSHRLEKLERRMTALEGKKRSKKGRK